MNLNSPLSRIASIDILRAFTMTLMIFVNDLWSLSDIPLWLEHTAADTDGMGLADVVFPAFLVIVGMSIPFSVASRRNKGEPDSLITFHIVQRAFALIVMGIFLVNAETINEQASGIRVYAWNMLVCLSFILLWNSYPDKFDKRIILFLKMIGWIILITLAWIYRGSENGEQRFTTSWWGILGLIGWAYLAGAIIYTFLGNNLLYIVLSWLLFIIYCVVNHAGVLSDFYLLKKITAPLEHGAMPAFVLAGVTSSMLFRRFRKLNKPYALIVCLALISAGLMITGFYLRQFWGISKIHATPSWVLICSGITLAFFAFIYWIADLKGKAGWFAIIKPAGTNTLLCYLLPYFVYALMTWFHVSYPETISHGFIGLIKSLLFSIIIVNIAGVLSRYGVRLKL